MSSAAEQIQSICMFIAYQCVLLHSCEQQPDCNLMSNNRVITTQNFGRNLEETLLEKYNKHKI